MKKNLVFAILLCSFFTSHVQAQTFGYFASAVWLKDSTYTGFFNTYDTSSPSAISNNPRINFDTTSLGVFPQNSGSLTIGGGELKTFKNNDANVCVPILYYTVYPNGNRPTNPVFSPIKLNFFSNCSGGVFLGGGPCNTGDQKWQTVDSITDLTTYAPGDYTLEVYYQIPGSDTSTSSCSETTYDNNNGNATNYTANFTIDAILPVTLVNFTGAYHQSAVALGWTVADEVNEKGFEVDRSLDGQTFAALSFINSKGNNAGSLSYSYSDNKLPAANKLYYRIKLVDNDGKFVYSPIVAINTAAKVFAQFTALLNNNILTVHLASPLGNNSQLELTDMQGRVIMKKSLAAQGQSSMVVLPLNENVARGMYIITIYDGSTGSSVSNKVEASY